MAGWQGPALLVYNDATFRCGCLWHGGPLACASPRVRRAAHVVGGCPLRRPHPHPHPPPPTPAAPATFRPSRASGRTARWASPRPSGALAWCVPRPLATLAPAGCRGACRAMALCGAAPLISVGSRGPAAVPPPLSQGFNAVYHLTDLPSFVSGSSLVLFDPRARRVVGLHTCLACTSLYARLCAALRFERLTQPLPRAQTRSTCRARAPRSRACASASRARARCASSPTPRRRTAASAAPWRRVGAAPAHAISCATRRLRACAHHV